MDIYSKKSRWKLYLFITAVFIIVISLLYTSNVAERLADEERKRAQLWAGAVAQLESGVEDSLCMDRDLDFIFSIVDENKTIPAILTDENDAIETSINFAKEDTAYLRRQLNSIKSYREPIKLETPYYTKYLYYKNSRLLTLLINFPYFQLVLIAIFLLAGYLGFSTARKAEQNQVWVGFAKETAHQLGTPISAIVAWIEHLKLIMETDEEGLSVLQELRKDVGRLELIAERFSKIGAIPDLEEVNVLESLERNLQYMKRRAPRKVKFHFPSSKTDAPIMAKINPPLFDWVIENLLKNALDAMERKGNITATAFEDAEYVYIDIQDTGKGIPTSKFKTVFKPGYSTKKRGWGLGLSLTQRIIKNYHNGKIFVKSSELGKGTTFRIQLPKT